MDYRRYFIGEKNASSSGGCSLHLSTFVRYSNTIVFWRKNNNFSDILKSVANVLYIITKFIFAKCKC